MEANGEVLEYKNFWLFYEVLYRRLFSIIDSLIDENSFNIIELKSNLIDFTDVYSYYLKKRKLLKADEKHLEVSLEDLKEFDSFTSSLVGYPSSEFILIRHQLKQKDYDLKALSPEEYCILIKEYYDFFGGCINIMKKFVTIASANGFLPNIKSKSATKSIGYANYDSFFKSLENLKGKVSDITKNVKYSNMFKSRRALYCLLVILSPYFKNQDLTEELISNLNFDFINDNKTLTEIHTSYNYKTLSEEIKKNLDEKILFNLKETASLTKRFISYETGERDMSPTIKKKYLEDPTNT